MSGAAIAAALGIALLLAGGGFASPSLLVPGAGLTAMALAAAVWVGLAARGLRLERGEGPPRVEEGEPYPLRISARGGALPPPGGELRDPLLSDPVPIGPGWGGLHTAAVRLSGRGVRRLLPAKLELRDPLGLCVREIESADGGELLVLPRVEPVRFAERGGAGRALADGGLEDGPAASGLDPRAIELEVDGLRPYREGSPASRIHWPAVARSGELIERRLVAGAETAPLVVLDASTPAGEEALNAAVRATASLAVHLARAGGCGVLLPGDRRATELTPDLRGWPAVHARLALVEPAPTSPPLARIARAGAVVWVSAAAAPRPPRAVRTTGPRYLVSPSSSLSGPAAFEVAGCRGVLATRVGRAAAIGGVPA